MVDLSKLSEREKKLGIATLIALVIGLTAIGYKLIKDSMMDSPISESTAIHFEDLFEKIHSVEEQKKQNNVYRKQIGNETGTFADENSMSQLFAELSQVGQKSQFKIKSMDPNLNARANPLPKMDIRISAECKFEDLIQFLDNLRSAKYLMQPTNIRMSLKDKNRPDLQVQMTVSTYLLDVKSSALPPNALVRPGS